MNKEIGRTIKQIFAGESGVNMGDLITDLVAFAEDIEKFGVTCEKHPFVIAGKGKDVELINVLLAAIREFKDAIRPGEPKKISGWRLLKKPAGPGNRDGKLGQYWNNARIGTERSVICEVCGTTHQGGTPRSFLGLQLIEECCGALVDRAYEEIGEAFAIAFLTDFSKNPTSDKFNVLLFVLKEVLRKAKTKLEKTTETVAEISAAAEKL